MWTWRLAFVPAAFMVVGCTGGIHRRGEQQIVLTGSYGHPIKGNVLWPDGEGRADNAGVSLGYHYFAADRTALMAVLTPYRNYNEDGINIWEGEFQLGVRQYFWEFDAGSAPVGLYAEALVGMMTGSDPFPSGGSCTNYTQDTGVGFEVRLNEHISWITGYRLRHVSNWYAFGEENPSQNDNQVYTGIAITFE